MTQRRTGMDENPQGRPETHWRRSVLAEKAKVGMSWEKVKASTQTRVRWGGGRRNWFSSRCVLKELIGLLGTENIKSFKSQFPVTNYN